MHHIFIDHRCNFVCGHDPLLLTYKSLCCLLAISRQQSYAGITAIEGRSSNLKIPCPNVVFRPLEMSGVQIFWKINKTPYRINEVPSPFDVSTDEFALVLTGLAHRAYDGYTFQCIGIEWGADGTSTREFLGQVTTLLVFFAPEGKFKFLV